MKKTYEDGWECVPELRLVVDKIDECGEFVYEIKKCVRSHDLDYMVEDMKEKLQSALDILENIDTDQEFITVDHDEDDE